MKCKGEKKRNQWMNVKLNYILEREKSINECKTKLYY